MTIQTVQLQLQFTYSVKNKWGTEESWKKMVEVKAERALQGLVCADLCSPISHCSPV